MRALLQRLSFALLLGLAVRQEKTREVELVYLANEGFLARVGETKLVIDAFVTEPYSIYAAVPAELFDALLAKRAPFDGLDLVLTSHFHGDHFQKEPAARFLAANAELPFVSSPQVLDGLRAELGETKARLRPLLPEPGKTASASEGGVEIELLRLPHSGDTVGKVENLGHLMVLGGVRLLHVGDAEVSSEALDGYDLEKRAVDVALVPYWWLGSAKSVARVHTLLGSAVLVAVHVPPQELTEVRTKLAALDPEILLFEKAGESRTLELPARD